MDTSSYIIIISNQILGSGNWQTAPPNIGGLNTDSRNPWKTQGWMSEGV